MVTTLIVKSHLCGEVLRGALSQVCPQCGVRDHIREAIGKGRIHETTVLLFEFKICVHREVEGVNPTGAERSVCHQAQIRYNNLLIRGAGDQVLSRVGTSRTVDCKRTRGEGIESANDMSSTPTANTS